MLGIDRRLSVALRTERVSRLLGYGSLRLQKPSGWALALGLLLVGLAAHVWDWSLLAPLWSRSPSW